MQTPTKQQPFLTLIFENHDVIKSACSALCNQTNKAFEVIAVGTEMKKSDKNHAFCIKYAPNIQKAIQLASGKYIYFMKENETFCNQAVDVLQQNTADQMPDMVGFSYNLINNDGTLYHDTLPEKWAFHYLHKHTFLIQETFNFFFCFADMPCFFRADFLKQNKLSLDSRFGKKIYQVIWLKSALNSSRIMILPDKIITRRRTLFKSDAQTICETIAFWDFARDVIGHEGKIVANALYPDFIKQLLNDFLQIDMTLPHGERTLLHAKIANYIKQIKLPEQLTDQQIAQTYRLLCKKENTPLISVITCIDGASVCDLQKLMQSIQAQTLSNYEMIVIDANSDNNNAQATLNKFEKADSRIFALHNTNNSLA